jgi:hypothetical protein
MATSAPLSFSDLALFRRRGDADDARAHRLADLHGGKPGQAGGAEHAQRLARLQLASLLQA